VIRRATPEDAEGIARVQGAAWMSAYSGFIDPGRLAERGEVQTRETWEVRLASDRALTWVALEEAAVVGFASAGYAEEEDLASSRVAILLALYVDPERWSQGHGRALHDEAVSWMRSEGYKLGVLWVMAGNGRGRAFYTKAGWTPEPATLVDDPAFWNAPSLRYRMQL
jgi:GNAT superfamily N-acetyltransferase